MDSISQWVLGANIWELIWAKRLWNRAVWRWIWLWTLPDLDVFVGPLLWWTSFDSTIFHRGITHSVVFCVIAAPLIGWLIARLYHKDARDWKLRSWISFFAFLSHILLDLLTSYGTKILEPRSSYWRSLDVIAIADPLWTLPFLWWVIWASWLTKTSKIRRRIALWSMTYALLYISMAFVNKSLIQHRFEQQLVTQQYQYTNLATYPEFLQQALRRGIASINTGRYVEWYASLLDSQQYITFNIIEWNHQLLSWYQLSNNNLATLIDITKWYFMIQQSWSNLILYDLRFWRLLWRDTTYTQQWMFGRYIVWCRVGQSLCDINPYFSADSRSLSRGVWNTFWYRVRGYR